MDSIEFDKIISKLFSELPPFPKLKTQLSSQVHSINLTSEIASSNKFEDCRLYSPTGIRHRQTQLTSLMYVGNHERMKSRMNIIQLDYTKLQIQTSITKIPDIQTGKRI
jgi:GTP cyclohydrolase II